ncbi:hypothetical protein, partial [Burkholderia sp. SIMBA_024]|uniref:hypothetical protein n=1 Tax=Burkholderia sp. SIMBA_024 TaxID=3085768 RepID=UPI00397A5B5D
TNAVGDYLKSLGDSEFHALMALIRRILESPHAYDKGRVVEAFSQRYGFMLSSMEAEREARAALT